MTAAVISSSASAFWGNDDNGFGVGSFNGKQYGDGAINGTSDTYATGKGTAQGNFTMTITGSGGMDTNTRFSNDVEGRGTGNNNSLGGSYYVPRNYGFTPSSYHGFPPVQ